MTEPTATRQALRRAIALKARMPFFLAYGDTDVALADPTSATIQTTDVIYAPSLTQTENFWQNAWVYVSDSAGVYGTERRIQAFERSGNKIIPEWPFDTAPAAADRIEIYHIWPPSQINSAINDALEEGGEYWPAQTVDESMIVVEDRLAYDISGLSVTPWKMLQIRVERSSKSVTGTCTSACTSAVVGVDTDDDLSGIDTDWYVSIYDGPGKGQVRSVISGDTLTNLITVGNSAATYLTTDADSTSKYRWWDADEQWHDWVSLLGIHFNRKDYPDKMYLQNLMPSVYGFRFRQTYLGWPSALSADSDVTSVPKEFVVNKALATLHDSMIGDNRVDRTMHGGTAEYYADRAAEYARLHRRRVLAGSLWQDEDEDGTHVSSAGDDIGNPLGW